MDQTPPVRSEYLVSGIRTPPVRRNSKLATLGRIFKPWKWRKKKNEKLKQTTSVLEKKMAGRQGREELIKKGLLEMMEQDAESKTASPDSPQSAQSEPPAPQQDVPTPEDAQPGSPLAAEADQASVEEPPSSDAHLDDAAKMQSAPGSEDVDAEHARSLLPTPDELSQALAGSDSLESAPRPLERPWGQLPSPPQLPTPPPKASSKATKSVTGQATFFQGSSMKSPSPPLRGQLSTPTGSPHLTTVHRPLPPSRVIEELHRALATKHRQDSFQGRESKGSPKKRADVRLSRTSSLERGKGKEEAWSSDGATESKRAVAKESEENKENLILNSELQDDLLLYQDEEALNESVISGTLPRRCKMELLAVKLRTRPSKQELEDRNVFPQRTDEERQEIRQQIEMKLSKRLSQRPAVEELERRNILKQRNDQTEQEERREIKQRLTRKLNQRPTVDELRDRKILIRFSDYVEVARAQDYDRRADKPWTRLSAADKAAIRKELNEYKSNEMEVHASSKHLTRFHRP
ncbi:phosphatase and actin regulator 3 [Tupaia chinensis]|uniref:phosphatase and actin regulator 3 n=1 Tax=Tupaia chinensis TaxID=246437 RepID=UPI0003C8D136|nr:phosphatase and actin regulator 3 [Tupaia chinensis]XP_006141913.1 phosphatase and actin regulator 3 [Tupaia chinensis]XP_006141914.1 phosphatase and actin regulator 3 [Tupaia chinensis]